MWTGEYVLDFDEVFTRAPPVPSPDDDEEADSDRPVFSLVTGTYRHAKRYGGEKLSYFRLWPFLLKKLRHRSRWDSCASIIVLRTYPQGSRWHSHDTPR